MEISCSVRQLLTCKRKKRLQFGGIARHPLLHLFRAVFPETTFLDLTYTIKTEPEQFYSAKFAFKVCFSEDSVVNSLAISRTKGKTIKNYNDNDTQISIKDSPKKMSRNEAHDNKN